MKIDTLEIQRRVEEIRHVNGHKLKQFLLRKTKDFFAKVDHILSAENFCFWSVSLIFLLSIFLRSRVDIGHDSGFYLSITRDIAQGGKYYYDFFESNFPLSFYIHLIPHYIAKATGFSVIIVADYFVNILALISIYSSYLILKKADFSQAHKNIIISSCALGFFLRIETLPYNEFLTKSSFYLIFAFPYICYSFHRITPLTKGDMLFRGTLAGLIPCLKPHYIILPLIIELGRFWRNRNFRFFVELDKLMMIAVGVGYLLFMIKVTPEFFEYMVPMWSSVYSAYSFGAFFENFSHQLWSKVTLLIIFFVFLHKKLSAQDKILLQMSLSAAFIMLLEGLMYALDQYVCFLSIATIAIMKVFYDFVKDQKDKIFKRNLLFVALLILAFFDEGLQNFRSIMFFWFFLIPIISYFAYKKFIREFPDKMTKKIKVVICFVAFVFLSLIPFFVILSEVDSHSFITLSSFVLFFFIFLHEILYKKYYNKISNLMILITVYCALSILSSYVFKIMRAYQKDSFFKSPNIYNNTLIEYGNLYLTDKKNDRITFIDIWLFTMFPTVNFLDIDIDSRVRNEFLFANVNSEFGLNGVIKGETERYIYEHLKNSFKDPNNKMIVVTNRVFASYRSDLCSVGFLEYYFQDPEFKKLFFENYEYSGRIFFSEEEEASVSLEFFAKEKDDFDGLSLSKHKEKYNSEIYLRKDAK